MPFSLWGQPHLRPKLQTNVARPKFISVDRTVWSTMLGTNLPRYLIERDRWPTDVLVSIAATLHMVHNAQFSTEFSLRDPHTLLDNFIDDATLSQKHFVT